MAVEINSKEGRAIRKLVPLATLSKTRFAEICADITIEEEAEGYTLFKKDDCNDELIYLLSGEVTLKTDQYLYETIAANSDISRFALAHQSPRQIDGYAKTGIRFFRIAGDLIQNPLAVCNDEKNDSQEVEITEECQDDWMTTLLKSPVFQLLPAFNLQQILIGLEEVQCRKGDLIIDQDKHGDYYFLVRKGRCMMTRKPAPNAKSVGLGELRDNDTFGEDSLLSGEPNHYSVTALSDTSLLRLEKEKFITLIKKPVVEYIEFSGVKKEIEKGALILDVRMPDAFNHNHLDGSVNIPFFSLRMQFNSLDRRKKILVVCENSKISEAAAFFLLRNKFEAVVLNGGMSKAPQYLGHQTATFEIKDGVESVIGRSTPFTSEAENEVEEASPQAEELSYSNEIKEKICRLKYDNEKLVKTNLQLKQRCVRLIKEKEQAEKQLLILSRQKDRLKEILGKIQSNSSNTKDSG